jgi:hypothetical protein
MTRILFSTALFTVSTIEYGPLFAATALATALAVAVGVDVIQS